MLQLLLRRCGIKGTKPTVSKPAAAGELAQGELWLNNNHESPGLFARADDDSLIEFTPEKPFLQDGANAKPRTYLSKLKETVSVKDFGAVGDGVADDTAAIQAAINALPAGAQLTGAAHAVYVVTSLLLKSNMTLRDIKLKTKAGAVDFVAPITIDGGTAAKTGITLIEVHVDGNRQNQTLVVSPSEDGGRHGFRVLGNVSHLSLIRCSANYCAGDGIELFSAGAKPTTDNYETLCFQDLLIDSCTFNWNRRHGITGDSINRGRFVNITAQHNGKDLNTTDPLTHGNRGARFSGNLYGRPFDFEGYGIGSAVNDIEIAGGFFTGNVSGGMFYDHSDPTAAGFQPRQHIRISNAHFDESSGIDFAFVVFASNTTGPAVYKNVSLVNCQFDSSLQLKGVSGFSCYGGRVVSGYSYGYCAKIELCSDYSFITNATKQDYVIDAIPAVVTQAQTVGTVTFAAETISLEGFTPSGYLIRHFYNALDGAIGNGYARSYTAPAGYHIRCYQAALSDANTVAMQPLSALVGQTGTVLSVLFNLTVAGPKQLEVVYELYKA